MHVPHIPFLPVHLPHTGQLSDTFAVFMTEIQTVHRTLPGHDNLRIQAGTITPGLPLRNYASSVTIVRYQNIPEKDSEIV
jgi:hypothetical protein